MTDAEILQKVEDWLNTELAHNGLGWFEERAGLYEVLEYINELKEKKND